MISRVSQVLDAVSAVQKAVTISDSSGNTQGITAVYPFVEWSVASVNCPFFANMVSGGESDIVGTTTQVRNDVIHMYLLLQAIQEGQSLSVTLQYVLDWVDAVYAAFAAAYKLHNQQSADGNGPLVNVVWISAWDMSRYTLGATTYFGLKFDLTVQERFTAAVAL